MQFFRLTWSPIPVFYILVEINIYKATDTISMVGIGQRQNQWNYQKNHMELKQPPKLEQGLDQTLHESLSKPAAPCFRNDNSWVLDNLFFLESLGYFFLWWKVG